MRIAISGSHLVGKTTVAEALAETLPHYDLVPEPYYLLEEEGFLFPEMPSVEDFEMQLERSFQCLLESGPNVIFDRCPLDILGYLITHQNADMFQIEDWMPRVQESLVSLDLIIFIPVEEPDRIITSHSQLRLRADVDEVLRDIIVDDAYGLDIDVITVPGSLASRLDKVAAHTG